MKIIIAYLFIATSLLLSSVQSYAETEASLKMAAYDAALTLPVRLHAAKQLAKKSPNNVDYLLLLGNLAMNSCEYGTAIDSYDSIYANHYQNLNKPQQCQFLYDYGNALYLIDGKRAIDICKQLLSIDKTDTLKRFDFRAYAILSSIAGRVNKTILESRSLKKLKDKYDELEKEKLLSPQCRKEFKNYIHNIKIFAFRENNQLDSLIIESKMALQHASSAKDSTAIIGTIARAYSMMNREDIAESHYLQIINDIDFNLNTTVAIMDYCALLLHYQRYDDILKICERKESKILNTGINEFITYLYFFKGRSLVGIGQLEEGAIYMDKSLEGLQILYKTTYTSYESLTEFEINEILNENEADKDMARQRGWWLVAAGIVILAILCVAFVLWRRLRKAKTEISDMNEKYKDDFQRFDAQHRELTSLSLQLAKLQSVVDDAKKSLADNGNSSAPAYGMLREAIAEADSWNSFKLYFEGCHPHFMKNLYERHPQLSENDVRTCVYMLLNFTTKEIASLTNRSVRTIETQKYRLGKKLNLGPDTSVLEYLRRLT